LNRILRVVVVDADIASRTALTTLCENARLDVVFVSGLEALDLLMREEAAAVVLHVTSRAGPWRELVRQLAFYSDRTALFVVETETAGIPLREWDYLLPPTARRFAAISPSELVEKVQEALRGRTDPLTELTPPGQEEGSEMTSAAAAAVLGVGLARLDLAGQICAADLQFCRLLGVRPADLEGKSLLSFVDAQDAPRTRDLLASIRSGDVEAARGEFRRQVAAGQPRWFLLGLTRPTDASTEPAIAASLQDISARKWMQRVLNVADQWNRQVIEGIPAGMVHLARDGTLVGANAEAALLLGRPPDLVTSLQLSELISRTIREDGTPFPAEEHPALRCLESGQPQSPVTLGLRQEDGSIRWVLLSVIPLSDLDAKCESSALLMFVDVTQQKQADEALRHAAERFSLVTLATQDGIFDWDLHTDYVWRNDAYHRLFAAGECAEPQEQWWRDRIHPDDRPRVLASLRQVLESDEIYWTGEYRFRRPDDSYADVSARGYILRGANNEPLRMIGAISDIGVRKREEEARRQLEIQMQEADRLRSLTVFAGGVAHDFNNLLQGMLTQLEKAQAHLPDASPLRDHLDQIQRSTLRAVDLSQQMLAYAGKRKFTLEAVDLNRIVTDTLDLLGRAIRPGAAVHCALAAHLPVLHADPTQLRQVVMNLILNAAEALPAEGGEIRIESGLTRASDRELPATIPGQFIPAGRYVRLEVRDTGVGMSADLQRRIFEPFFTTKPAGRGLGLAVVMGIVSGHHGTVLLESAPGQGTTFRVLLPVPPAQAAIASEGEETAEHQELPAGTTILVIDDEPALLDAAQWTLRRSGAEVLLAGEGATGIELCRRHAGRIHAVLLDLSMPDLDSEQILQQLRAIRPHLPVILSSGRLPDESTENPASRGRTAFLPKPYRPADLIAKINEVLRDV